MCVCDIEPQPVNVLRSRPNDRYFEEDILNSFPSTIVLGFSLTFHWKFSRVMSTICNNLSLVWVVNGLASNSRQQVIIRTNDAHIYRGIHASLGLEDLIKYKCDSSPYIYNCAKICGFCIVGGGGVGSGCGSFFCFFLFFFLGGADFFVGGVRINFRSHYTFVLRRKALDYKITFWWNWARTYHLELYSRFILGYDNSVTYTYFPNIQKRHR